MPAPCTGGSSLRQARPPAPGSTAGGEQCRCPLSGSPIVGVGSGLSPPGVEELNLCTEHSLLPVTPSSTGCLPSRAHAACLPPAPPESRTPGQHRRTGHRGSHGGCALPAPRSRGAAHLWPLVWGRGAGSRLHPARGCPAGAPSPPVPARAPAGVPHPAPEPPGSARPGACGARRGHPARALGALRAPAAPEALRGSQRLRGRGRVLANIYSQIHNCFAFFFVIW